MRKIFNGFRYDSDTADKIGKADNLSRGVDSVTDFNYWEATLYRTRKAKRFFLVGTGGAMTRYGKQIGQSSFAGGSKLEPLTDEEARLWAEEYLTAVEIEAAFEVQDA